MARDSAGRRRLVMHAIRVISIVVFTAFLIITAGILLDRLVIGTLVAFFVILFAVRWWRARPATKEAKELRRLIALCRNDRAMAERLVAGEERRSPGVSRRVLVRRAIDRLIDDRGR